MAVIDKLYKSMGLPMVIDRGSPWALDTTSVWYSRDLLEIYARGNAEELKANNLPATAYVGQEVSLVDETNKTVTVYVISDAEGTLTPVGGGAQVLCDDTTIVLNDGELSLKDYGHRYYRYVSAQGTKGEADYIEAHYELQEVDELHPWKAGLEARVAEDSEGNLSLGWFEQNLSSTEGLTTQVTNVQTSVTNLTTNVTNLSTQVTEIEENVNNISNTLYDQTGEDGQVVEGLVTKVNNTYRKDETYSREKIDEIVAGVFHFEGSVDSLAALEAIAEKNKGDVYQVGVDEYAWNGTEWVHLGNKYDLTGFVKTEELDNYVKTEVLDDYAKASDVQLLEGTVGSLETSVTTLESNYIGFESRVGSLESSVQQHTTDLETNANAILGLDNRVGSLDAELQKQSADLTAVQNSIVDLESSVGAPASEGNEATGLFREIKLVKDQVTELQLESGSGELNVIERVFAGSIELIPEDEVIYIPEMSPGVAGLVPAAVGDILANSDNYFLNASGNWAQPVDSRIGDLVLGVQKYNTVEEYVEAAMDERLTWTAIEE